MGLKSRDMECIFMIFIVVADFISYSWLENLLISAHILDQKISWFQLVFLARKSADFISYSWLENILISAHNLGQKISWFQLIFLAGKPSDFSSYSWPENQLISAHILGQKICWFHLMFLAGKPSNTLIILTLQWEYLPRTRYGFPVLKSVIIRRRISTEGSTWNFLSPLPLFFASFRSLPIRQVSILTLQI